jgi:hypothetical protein
MLNTIQEVANNENLFDHFLMEATKVCSLGQIHTALFEVGGQYRRVWIKTLRLAVTSIYSVLKVLQMY